MNTNERTDAMNEIRDMIQKKIKESYVEGFSAGQKTFATAVMHYIAKKQDDNNAENTLSAVVQMCEKSSKISSSEFEENFQIIKEVFEAAEEPANDDPET